MPELRPYQKEDIRFLAQRYAAGCFNEQRTGKTPTSLITMYLKKCTKLLIVCPASCTITWKKEYEKWLKQPCIICQGTLKQRNTQIANWTHGLIISYDTLKITKKSKGHIADILKQNPEGVIIDEAHRIKNYNSATAKAVFKLSNIKHKLALTATPAPNKPYEIWSILHFLFPKQFTSFWNFIDQYFNWRELYISPSRTVRKIVNGNTAQITQLQNILSQIATQRKRKDVFEWLPDKDKIKIYLQPTKEQQDYLDYLENYYEIPDSDIICKSNLDRLTRYRQICVTPALLNLKGESAKLKWLKTYFEDYPDRSVIIFTKFKTAIPEIIKTLQKIKYGVIVGDVSYKKRALIQEDFQKKNIQVLIAQIDTCKEGLTLDAAEAIIFLDKYPPAADIKQAEDRFIATCKERSAKLHLIYEIILENTYDEQIYNLTEYNANCIDILNDFNKYLKGEQ